jgi:hypothetical protein
MAHVHRTDEGRWPSSNVDLFCDHQRVIHLDAEVTDRALEFGMAEEELDRA